MSDKNIAVVQKIYQAFGAGDVPGILEHVAGDMRLFGVVSQSREIPWHMQITRKADVPSFFQALAGEVEFTRFEPRDFAASGDHVYCTVSLDATIRRNGRKLTMEDMHHFTFKNGQVVEWRGTEDSATIRDALLG
jgi:uncharacterized protein